MRFSKLFLQVTLIWGNLLLFSGCGEKQANPAPESGRNENVSSKGEAAPEKPSVKSDPYADSPYSKTAEEKRKEASNRNQVFRSSHTPIAVDEKLIQENGIRRYSSKRLVLYSDLEPALVEEIPGYVDQLHEALVDYFGELHPNREGTEFQVTGYLMGDRNRFVKSNLLPEDLPGFLHGRHRGTEFWMNEQPSDYYRRHLAFHEYVHCFMLIMPSVRAPVSYLEGMAESFGCHRIDGNGKCEFRVFPDRYENFARFERIEMIQKAVGQGNRLTAVEVEKLRPEEFSKNRNYAWSWAYCHFLGHHPMYEKMFQIFGKQKVQTVGSELLDDRYQSPDPQEFQAEWFYFIEDLCYGYELNPTAVTFLPGNDLKDSGESQRIEIDANRGWQSGQVHVEEGEEYLVKAKGKFILSENPRPWVSEAQGVSIAYFRDEPLGMLWATVIADPSDSEQIQNEFLMIPVGNEKTIRAKRSGTLYFRINDYADSLSDNKGRIEIEIKKVSGS